LKDAGAKLAREALHWHFPGYLQAYGPGLWRTSPVSVIRSGDWKLLKFYEGPRVELYNLAEDLGETVDLSGQRPEKREELLGRLNEWLRAHDAPMPSPKTE
jgi:arylsulfatase A-like enzyme